MWRISQDGAGPAPLTVCLRWFFFSKAGAPPQRANPKKKKKKKKNNKKKKKKKTKKKKKKTKTNKKTQKKKKKKKKKVTGATPVGQGSPSMIFRTEQLEQPGICAIRPPPTHPAGCSTPKTYGSARFQFCVGLKFLAGPANGENG